MELRIGDRVIIEPLTDTEKYYYEHGWSDDMDEYIGEITTIEDICNDNEYYLNCDGNEFTWSSSNLRLIPDYRYRLF